MPVLYNPEPMRGLMSLMTPCSLQQQGGPFTSSCPSAAAANATLASASGSAAGSDIVREESSKRALEAALAGDDSPVQHRLARELFEKRVPDFR